MPLQQAGNSLSKPGNLGNIGVPLFIQAVLDQQTQAAFSIREYAPGILYRAHVVNIQAQYRHVKRGLNCLSGEVGRCRTTAGLDAADLESLRPEAHPSEPSPFQQIVESRLAGQRRRVLGPPHPLQTGDFAVIGRASSCLPGAAMYLVP